MGTRLTGPLFKWFGSKWLSSKTLPAPQHDHILEPFAGSAGYALRYGGFPRQVTIWEEDPNLQKLWTFLITATSDVILRIPLGVPIGTDIRHLEMSEGQALLLKHWQRTNNVGDCWTVSPWGHLPGQWTANTRARVADEVGLITHWKLEPVRWDQEATYFVDPPYLYNYRYRFKTAGFDHKALAAKVLGTLPRAQVIMCEALCQKTHVEPTYLPFSYFGSRITSRRKATENHHSKELIFHRARQDAPETKDDPCPK